MRKIALILTFLSTALLFAVHPGYYKHKLIEEQQLTDGVHYKYILIGQRALKHPVHVLSIALNNDDIKLQPLKTPFHINQLSKLHDIAHYYDSVHNKNVIAAVNANFWRAYSNSPIGAFVIDGEIIEYNSYKQWSSFILDSSGTPYIYRINLSSMLINQTDTLKIDRYNRRTDSLQNVIYNQNYTLKIPFIKADLQTEFNSRWAVMNEKMLNNDSTEAMPDSTELMNEIINEYKTGDEEFKLQKIAFKYIDKPFINKIVRVVIDSIAFGEINVPENGFVLSISDSTVLFRMNIGDTLIYKTESDVLQDKIITQIITGTPRLVANGKAKHQAYIEGSTGRRFIHKRLARTAIGYNKAKDTLFLVTVGYTSRRYGHKGADLEDMSAIMKALGCYDALNLDGGGSTIMLINGENTMNKGNPKAGRKISTGFGVVVE
jgi:exopolysaccharide biosynthesis protein